MNNTSKLTIALAAAALSLGAAVSFASASSPAISMLEKCQPGSSRAIVEKCCAVWIKRNGRPLWMVEANTSCGDAVKCYAKKSGPYSPVALVVGKKKNCALEIVEDYNQGSGNPGFTKSPRTQYTND